MGVYSMIYQITSRIKKEDTSNSRTVRTYTRRTLGIAKDLEKSNNTTRLDELNAEVATVANQLGATEKSHSDSLTAQLSPSVYIKRREILTNADKTLNHFQPPPAGHPEEMRMAIVKDDKALGSVLEQLTVADDGVLKAVSEIVSNEPRKEIEASSSISSPTSALPNEEKAFEQLRENLEMYKKGKLAPSMMIGISDMGNEDAEATAHFIPLDYTFGGLADSLVNFSSEMFLPDFWCKEIDPFQNSVTPSAVWWQWQDPSKKVLEAINKEGHLRIETVCKEVEYVVVLVKKGETENGVPVDVPRTNRPRAFDYFQKLFPEYVVSRVCRLHGAEAANEVFDNRSFRHQTNPLFVELRSQVPKINTPVIGFTNGATNMDKGKGKSVTT